MVKWRFLFFLLGLLAACDQPVPAELKLVTLEPGLSLALVWVPPGSFQMGAELGNEDGPRHRVVLSRGFWMGQTEVTQAQWQAVMAGEPSYFKGPDLPVEQVSYFEARAFAKALSARIPGLAFRLPTEAEWEYACRAGEESPEAMGRRAWTRDNAAGRTQPVACLEPNPWGLYDMQGNVAEWCADWLLAPYDGAGTIDPKGAPFDENDDSESRVYRGGSWWGTPFSCRATFRDGCTPHVRVRELGFRVVATKAS